MKIVRLEVDTALVSSVENYRWSCALRLKLENYMFLADDLHNTSTHMLTCKHYNEASILGENVRNILPIPMPSSTTSSDKSNKNMSRRPTSESKEDDEYHVKNFQCGLKTLRMLVPGGNEMGFNESFSESESYVVCLELQATLVDGINAIMFYAPILFQTVGFKNDALLLSSVVTGLVNVISTMVSIVAVDRLRRRKLLLQASVQMFISQVLIGALLQVKLKAANTLDHHEAIFIVVLVCSFVMCFAWSWGPLGWLIPSETFHIETRTTGFAFVVMTNMLFTFIVAQAFLSMLCKMKAAIFFFFGGWILIMGLFVVFLVPETKNIAIDEMTERVWKQHWFWKNCMDNTPTPQQSRQPRNNARTGV